MGTTRGGEVLAIGRPRLRVSPDAGIGIAASAGRVFATDREAIAVWNLSDGTLLGRYQLAAEPGLPALTASPDGAFVTARGNLIAIAKSGAMTLAAALGGVAHRFSSDGVQLAMAWETPVIVDVATRRVVLTSPALATFSPTLDLDRSHWLRGDGVYAWDHARNAWRRLLEAKAPWTFGQLAPRAQAAIVVDKAGISRVDLVTRRSTLVVPKGTGPLAVSPNGERVAFDRDEALRIFDTRSGKEVASTPVTPGEYTPAAFVDDDVLVFRDLQDVRVFDLRTGLRAYSAPSRFAGWLDAATAALSRGAELDRLDIRTRATTALGVAPPAPPVPGCAAIREDGPCRIAAGKRRVSATRSSIEVFDGEVRSARLEVGTAPRWANEIKQQYVACAVSPDGSHLAVVWRRPDVFGPREGRGDSEPQCDRDRNSECLEEDFVEVWSLGKAAKRVWRSRSSRETATRTWPASKQASGALAFTGDGRHVLVGFDDGDVMIRSTSDERDSRLESLHRATITRIVVSPGDASVFTEDGSGEQRIWTLSR